ncbi:hypothetical protein ACFOLF_01060 [Paenibacillus sepulcri]|uniref:DUF4822 domain-containing protein n=1 Tax=Paenibacillus sepulcri TaxID=359917 RepID=A0ABS7CCE3_9BACL|nr:hypothetical protein [Paenibacillus sepulcri]
MRKIMLIAVVAFLMLTQISFAGDNDYHAVPTNSDTHAAFINQIYQANGKTYVTADYIQWFEGDEANKVFLEHNKDSGLDGAPDGYYILNENDKLRTFEVSGDAIVLMQIYNRTGDVNEMDINWNEKIDVNKLRAIFADNDTFDVGGYPFHLTIENNKIVKIVQQYIP